MVAMSARAWPRLTSASSSPLASARKTLRAPMIWRRSRKGKEWTARKPVASASGAKVGQRSRSCSRSSLETWRPSR